MLLHIEKPARTFAIVGAPSVGAFTFRTLALGLFFTFVDIYATIGTRGSVPSKAFGALAP
jgi:hypothetical protein